MPEQQGLFDAGAPAIDAGFTGLRRTWLDERAWFDHAPGWVAGHARLLDELAASTSWRHERIHIYERTVDVPRLVAALPADGPGHPLLDEMARALSARYGERFPQVSMGLYRDGRDSVAWHGDRVARDMDQALVATVSLGEPRRFLMRPTAGGRSRALALGWGDLLVMGGSAQRTWRHAVPKVAHAGRRVVIMFRPAWARVY